MRRRSYLAAAGLVVAGLAGCGRSSSRTIRTPPGAAGATVTDGNVELSLDQVHRGLVRYTSPDSISVTDRDRRHVSLAVERSDDTAAPEPGDFALRFDGEEYAPMSVEEPWELYRYGSFHTAEDPGGWLLFDLPASGDASDAALTWPGNEWPLSRPLQRRLGSAPAFDVSVTADGEAIEVTATNTGERPQRFLLAANQAGPMYAPIGTRTALLSADGTETFDFTPSPPPVPRREDGPATVRLPVSWVDGDGGRSVEVG